MPLESRDIRDNIIRSTAVQTPVTPPPNEADDATTEYTRAQLRQEAEQNAAERAVPRTPPINEAELGSTTTTMEEAASMTVKSIPDAEPSVSQKSGNSLRSRLLEEGRTQDSFGKAIRARIAGSAGTPSIVPPATSSNKQVKTFGDLLAEGKLPAGSIPVAARLTATKQETKALIKALGPELPTIAKEMVLSATPVVGTVREAQRAWEDRNITPGEAASVLVSAGLDAMTLIPIVSGASAAARGTAGLGRAARIVAATKAAGKLTVAEVVAPITMLKHPVRSVKELGRVAETVLPRRVPLASVETSYSLVRLPVGAFKDADAAKVARDAVTVAAESGRTSAKAVIGSTEVELTKAAIQKLGKPVALSATPDISPFLHGATVKYGREGGLFVAPNVSTRFSVASAFGDKPAGGIPGVLIIRDENVLGKLVSSNKVYTTGAGKPVVEIESLLPAGAKLPKPSQQLFTRRADGQLLTMLVYGKKFTPAEVARMKVLGSLDTVRSIFTPPARIGKATAGTTETARSIRSLQTQLGKATKAGNAKDAARLERELERALQSARGAAAAALPLRVAVASVDGRPTVIDKWRHATGATGERLPDIVLPAPAPVRSSYKRTGHDTGKIERVAVNVPVRTTGDVTRDATSATRPPEGVAGTDRVAVDDARPGAAPARPGITGEPVRGSGRGTPEVTTGGSGRVPDVPERPGIPSRPGVPVRPGKPSRGAATVEPVSPADVEGIAPAVSWRQGIVWHTIEPPFKGKTEVSRDKPPGTTVVKGPKSAYRTAKNTGRSPLRRPVTIDSGVLDIEVVPDGKHRGGVRMKFKPDKARRTISNMTTKHRPTTISKKVGKYYITKLPGTILYSRHPLKKGRKK